MEKVQDKVLDFLVKNYYIVLIVILLFGLYLRIKYMNVNAAVWWDEAEYLSTAKHWAFDVPYTVSSQRQPLFPLFISFLYLIGITSMPVIKFLGVIIPSVLLIYVTYLLAKEMFDKQTGLISAFIMSIFWVILFWSARFSTDVFGLLAGLLAFYFFWKSYERKSKYGLYLSAIFLGLGFLTRIGGVLPVAIIGLYLLVTRNIKLIKDTRTYIFGGVALLTVIPYLIWNKLHFGNIFAFWNLYFGPEKTAQKLVKPFAWFVFDYPRVYLGNILLIFFLLGLFLIIIKVIFSLDLLIKNKNNSKAEFFTFLMILIPIGFFAFIERGSEPRWPIIMSAAVFIVTARGLLYLYEKIKGKIPNYLSVLVIIAIIGVGSMHNLQTADANITARSNTYTAFKDAGEWIKEHSAKDDIVYNNGVPQSTFYSERETWAFGGGSPELFEEKMKETKTRYVVISLLEKEPEWMSQESFGQNSLNWKLPYFDAELIAQNNQVVALFKGEEIDQFPPSEVVKNGMRFTLVYSKQELFIYEVEYL